MFKPEDYALGFMIFSKVLLGVLLVLFWLRADAAPNELLGHCFETDHLVIEEWENRLPVVDVNGRYISYTVLPFTPSTAGGVLTVPYTSQVDGSPLKQSTAIFPPCDAGVVAKGEPKYSLETLIISAVGFAFVVLGFNAGKYRF